MSPAWALSPGGNSQCNYSSGNPYEYIAVGCEYNVLQYEDASYLTMPSSGMSVPAGTTASVNLTSFSGNPCTLYVQVGGTYNGSNWELEYTYHDSQSTYSTSITSVSGGSTEYAYLYYQGGGVYQAYIGGYSYSHSGLGGGSCLGTAGTDIVTSSYSSVKQGNSAGTPLYWYDTSYGSHQGWNGWYNSAPCGGGQSPPYCLNGAYYSANGYSNNNWQSNKP